MLFFIPRGFGDVDLLKKTDKYISKKISVVFCHSAIQSNNATSIPKKSTIEKVKDLDYGNREKVF